MHVSAEDGLLATINTMPERRIGLGHFEDADLERAVEQADSLNGVLRLLGVTENGYWLRKLRARVASLDLDTRHFTSRRYNDYSRIDQDYFSRVNVTSAYWAGFLAADGSVQRTKLRLRLSVKDEDQMDRFLAAVGMPQTTKRYRTTTPYGSRCVEIHVACREWVHSLVQFGIVENKTFQLRLPDLGAVDLNLSYLQGYFDGDGSISGGASQLTSGSLQFLQDICERYDLPARPVKSSTGNCWRLTLGRGLLRRMNAAAPASMPRKRVGDGTRRSSGPRAEASRHLRKFDPAGEELRDLVWSMPSTGVAKLFGVSDVAVAKRCRLLGIEKPGRGYWASRSDAGQLGC